MNADTKNTNNFFIELLCLGDLFGWRMGASFGVSSGSD
jgi:hypothetical protein